jgi:prepilin-type N-terminal cleavage/methylation domain-containing protein
MNKSCTKQQGFTLIELLIYMFVFSMIFGGLITQSIFIQRSRISAQARLEVDRQGASAVRTMTQQIRNARSISAPTVGNSASSLTIIHDDAANSPILITISDGVLLMKKGNKPQVALTNNKVTASITFSNVSRPSTSGIVSLRLVLDGKDKYDKRSATFYGSAALRNGL